MKPDRSKLQHRQEEQQQTEPQTHLSGQQQHAREFESVEELLRFDAQQVAVPPALTERVQETIAKEPDRRSWWERLFGSKS